MGDELVHAVLAGLNESASKGGLIIRKKKDEGGGDSGFKVNSGSWKLFRRYVLACPINF